MVTNRLVRHIYYIDNTMDGKDYQQGSNENYGNREPNSATIQDDENTVYVTYYNT